MAKVGKSIKKQQKAYKKEVIGALKEMIQNVKNANVVDVELEANQERPPCGTFMESSGIMTTVPGSILITDIRLTFKSKAKG